MTKLKPSLCARCAPPCLTLHQGWGLFQRWILGSIRLLFFVVVSLFHGLLMGSRHSFQDSKACRASHDNPKRQQSVRRWYPNRCLLGALTTGLPWSWVYLLAPGGGGGGVTFAQQVINAFLTQRCRAGKKETLEEFGVLLMLSHSQSHGSESIDHHGASELIECRRYNKAKEEKRGKEPRLASCKEAVGRRGQERRYCMCRGRSEGRKAIFWSFKEPLFHGKLKSHYKDYMAANNVRQISI